MEGKDLNPYEAFFFCKEILRGRSEELEKIIIKNTLCIEYYVSYVIRGRCEFFESLILKLEPRNAAYYAREVILGRWPEGENYIMKDPEGAYIYAKYIMKSRWPEAEKYISKNGFIFHRYKLEFGLYND